MKIIELRILPPIAIGRLGSSSTPLAAYDLKISKEKPLDFRQIVPMETLIVDKKTGKITAHTPDVIQFKDVTSLEAKDGQIRPVAPFLEVFAITDASADQLVPLTTELLQKAGCSLEDIYWDVEVGNIKIFRRTGDINDKIFAEVKQIKDHLPHLLLGSCQNFLEGKNLPLGTVQFIAPSYKHAEIRLRFTPAEGKVYGAAFERHRSKTVIEKDPVIKDEAQLLYDLNKGTWRGYKEGSSDNPALYTNPAQIFAGYDDGEGNWVSWGYLDDACDGIISIFLKNEAGEVLKASAHISAGPPAFAPDTLPVRVVSDELEQILLGPDVDEDVPIEEAEEIVRRAFETIRLLNTAIMNGNPYNGRQNVASNMVGQDTNDFGRLYEPIMATSLVDNLALRALHERIFSGLSTGAASWFAQALRRPEEIGDLSNKQRRKMPAMMRGADGRALTLTRRLINKVIKAAASSLFENKEVNGKGSADVADSHIEASNLTAQLHYRGKGNPFSVLPRAAISNCFPGLEFDFRNLWRRAFERITLIENNNYVTEAEEPFKNLEGCRMVAIENKPTMVATEGPTFPDGSNLPLRPGYNPNGVSFMEWSNTMAFVLQKQGEEVICHFTKEPSINEVVVTSEDLKDETRYQPVKLKVNYLFEGKSASVANEILQPGELTQGLCAPWQNDYRECACYYWAASRPDYVNVRPNENGISKGDNWMTKKRSGEYIPDRPLRDARLLSYDDLFSNWEGELNFIIKGNDARGTDAADDDSLA